MSFKDWTPEQRAAARRKSVATRRANQAKKASVSAVIDHHDPLGDLASELLTAEEIAEIRVQAKAKVMAEQRAAAKKRVLDAAVEEERRAAGLIAPETDYKRWLEELVDIHVFLPKQGPTDHPTIMLDQQVFHSGRSYRVTRAQAQTMHEIMQRQRWHQSQIKGESRTYYDEIIGAVVHQGGIARGSIGMA